MTNNGIKFIFKIEITFEDGSIVINSGKG